MQDFLEPGVTADAAVRTSDQISCSHDSPCSLQEHCGIDRPGGNPVACTGNRWPFENPDAAFTVLVQDRGARLRISIPRINRCAALQVHWILGERGRIVWKPLASHQHEIAAEAAV